jgi:hypothetical protein
VLVGQSPGPLGVAGQHRVHDGLVLLAGGLSQVGRVGLGREAEVDPAGQLTCQRSEMLVARRRRDRVVQRAVRQPRGGDPVGGDVGGQRRADRRVVRWVMPDRGGARDALLDQRAIVVQRLHLSPDRFEDASRRGRVDGASSSDERAPGAATTGFDDAERGQPRQGLPDRGAADRQYLRQLALGGQLFPGLEHANRDRRQDAIRDRLGCGALSRAAPRQAGGRLIDRRFGHLPRP